ncbi:hypothetical protein F5B21DRAFT_457155 [Xylaria acuta]|nr:hypothetical protein F5B21DRAFT_457155 [Xylaria acuta]
MALQQSQSCSSQARPTRTPRRARFHPYPGLTQAAMTVKDYLPFARDDPMLAGTISLFPCTHRADWSRGEIISVNCKCRPLSLLRLEELLIAYGRGC